MRKKIGNSLCVGVRHIIRARIIWLLKSDVKRENQLLVKKIDKELNQRSYIKTR